jgi:hypothetical protein
MKTYWDLSERQRSELSEADVERYVDAELMTKGVLRPEPLELVEEPELPVPAIELHSLGSSYGNRLAFRNPEDAAHVARLAVVTSHEYINHQNYEYLSEAESDQPNVKIERVYSKAQLADCRTLMERASAARNENRRRKEAHEAGAKAVKDALEGLWADWYRCGSKKREMDRVLATFEEYKRIAEDEIVARRFLRKAFDPNVIDEASEWHGMQLETGPDEEAERIEEIFKHEAVES